MTDEQKAARKKSAETGNIKWIKDNYLRTKDGEDDYVFISYKSDDYKQVLDDIVYKTCRKYGLRVYFDTAFDEESKSWIEQYYENMSDSKCKAFLAFIDDAYYSSYATLLEMMSRKTAAAGGDFKVDSLFFLPINLGAISDIVDSSNTGLGTKRFASGKINKNAGLELEKFNEIFSEIADEDAYLRKKIYKRENDNQLYEEATDTSPEYGKKYLNVTQCRRIMERVIPYSNENDGTNKDFVEVIHDKLMNGGLDTVFKNKGQALEEVSEASEISSVTENKIETVGVITGPAPLVSRKADSASENQPEAIPDLVPGCMKKWTYHTRKGADAALLWDGSSKNCKVLKGSIAAKEAPNFAASASAAKKLKDQLVSQGNFSDLTFIADYDCDKISTMINLLNGASVSMPAEIKGKNLRLAEDECIYTYKNARIQCDINSNRCTVLKGSKTQGESPKFVTNAAGAKKLKDELKQKRIIENDVFLEDYTGSMATLLNLINGGSVSSTREKEKFVREN